MTVNIIQTITNTLDATRKVIKTKTIESYILYPAAGKALKNIRTGKVYDHYINLGSSNKVDEYIEINL